MIQPIAITLLFQILSSPNLANSFILPKTAFPTQKLHVSAPILPTKCRDLLTLSMPQDLTSSQNSKAQTRPLGSQELLFLPRQYDTEKSFPIQSHICVITLSHTPSVHALTTAIGNAIRTHPLLRAHVEGDGRPLSRIDFNKMVRFGNPNPERFVVSPPSYIRETDLLTVVTVGENESLEESWQRGFLRDVDHSDDWCDVHTGPLWKMELHRKRDENNPCALLVSMNHVISDQGSLNVVLDQIIFDLENIQTNNAFPPTVDQELPVTVEESVLGLHQQWNDIGFKGFTLETLQYMATKALEGFKNVALLPDGANMKPSGGALHGAEALARMYPGGRDKLFTLRRSVIQYRTVSESTTNALLEKCREQKLTLSSALAAASVLTCTDFMDGGAPKHKRRNYKVLQSLDMRRFGKKIDKGSTLACEAGSMDLIFERLPDRSGRSIRDDVATNGHLFWKVAEMVTKQTKAFIKNNIAEHAVRVFDMGMQTTEMNKLVDMIALSNDSHGRYYSAGITNAGVYERQKAAKREGSEVRETIKVTHGKYQVREIYYATSHARAGCLFPVSCLTVGDKICFNVNPPFPLVSEATSAQFADAFVQLLEVMASGVCKENEVDKNNGTFHFEKETHIKGT